MNLCLLSFRLLFFFLFVLLSIQSATTAPSQTVVIDSSCLEETAIEKCTRQVKNRYGEATDMRTVCCVKKRVIECEIDHRRRHCLQYKFLTKMMEDNHQFKVKEIQEKCGQFEALCTGNDVDVWVAMFQVFIAFMTLSGVILVIYVYFFG